MRGCLTIVVIFLATGLAIWLLRRALRLVRQGARWFEQHVYYRGAVLRSLSGPYVLVLRSFSNRMAVGRRIRRIFIDPRTGQEIDPTVVREDSHLEATLNSLGAFGLRPDLGESKLDLTVFTFLGEVRSRFSEILVAVSNGSSMGGVLSLVRAAEDSWFEMMQVLAKHSRAIVLIPDADAPALVDEAEFVLRNHAEKLAVLMPANVEPTEDRFDAGKRYRFEGIDRSQSWERARQQLRKAGLTLPGFKPEGSIHRFHPDGTLCGTTLPWNPAALAYLIHQMDSGHSDAQAARSDLKSRGLRLLRYDSPPETVLDHAWYSRAFPESYHPKTEEERRELAQFPFLGVDRPDHILRPDHEQAQQVLDQRGRRTSCERCPYANS